MDTVSLHVWHGGKFVKNPKLSYVGGQVNIFEGIDPDTIGYFDLVDLAKSCRNYADIYSIHYREPGLCLDSGIKVVKNDDDVMELIKVVTSCGFVQIYVTHPIHIHNIIEPQQSQNMTQNDICPSLTSAAGGPSSGAAQSMAQSVRKKLTPKKGNKNQIPNCTSSTIPFQSAATSTRNSKPNLTTPKTSTPSTSNNIPAAQSNVPTFNADDFEDNRPDSPLRFDELVSDVEDSDDPGYEPNDDDDGISDGEGWQDFEQEDLEFDEQGGIADVEHVFDPDAEIQEELQDPVYGADSDTDDDECIAARESLNKWNANIIDITVQLQKDAEEGKLKGQNKDIPESGNRDDGGCISEYEESDDDILTPGESEEDDILGKKKRDKGRVVTAHTDFSKLKWEVGMKFPNRKAFKDGVAKYSILQGRHLTFKVSDKNRQQRLGIRCRKGCPFALYGSWDSRRACFVLKTVNGKHTCQRNMLGNRQMKSSWLADQFLEVFKSRPHWPAEEICWTVKRAYKVMIKRGRAYKIKYWAHKKLHGSMKNHYNKVGRYNEAMKDVSPNSVFKLQVAPPFRDSTPPIFKRFYVCFDALSEGWLEGCRKVICLDGCFLKTFLGGILLAAVGRDANDQMYPIAWAVAEGETNESWEWFLSELNECLHVQNDGEAFTFVSDQQKGILNAVAKLFVKAEHRNCARHIFANWHKTYKGEEMKGLFWRAARAYNEPDYNDAIEEMESVSPSAAVAFKAQNVKTFCRAFIKTHTKCDVIVNNMAETFNGYIINARTKHLLDMLEDIRSALMTRLISKRLEMQRDESLICPRIQIKLEKEKDESGNCDPSQSDETKFEVKHSLDTLIVDLQKRTCSCRRWQLTGIPCCHAISCISFVGAEAESYVDECYHRATYLRSYSRSIAPCGGERHWPVKKMPLDPPPIKIMPGRPRRNRRKDPQENPKKPGKLTKHGVEMTCSICKSGQHTKRKCPDKGKVVVEPQPKRPRGRPRKHEVVQLSHTQATHSATAEPTRTGRRGRPIRGGRGSRGGCANRGGRGGSGNRGAVPTGFGVYVAENGATIMSNPGQRAPIMLSHGVTSCSYPMSSQASASINHP